MEEEGARHTAGEVGCDIRSDEEEYGGDERYGDAARFIIPLRIDRRQPITMIL